MSNPVTYRLASSQEVDQTRTNAFIQWKGTDVCLDFWCKCGGNFHIDGYFAHSIKCGHCGTIYEMPATIYPAERIEGESPC